jgi:quercetin dioxygenase-like cupin family protein
MAKVTVVTFERSQPVETPLNAKGAVKSRAYLSDKREPLHLLQHTLAPGATVTLRGEPSDVCVYLSEGAVTVGGRTLVKGSSLIVEYSAETQITAVSEGAVILAFHQSERPANARAGGNVHLLPREAVPCARDLGTQNEMGGGIHADAACPTCAVWLHENDFHRTGGTAIPLHSHSEDEIIFVTAGAIRLGNRLYGPGTALAIAAGTVYAFEAAPIGLSFINFRAASPTVTTPHGVHDEAEMWISRLGKPPYLTLRERSSSWTL